jgi:aminoglycoside/choline kinase family phosphotransferase
VPEVYGVDEAAGVYILEDLGETTLFDALMAAREQEGGGFPESMMATYRRVLEVLPRFQVEGGKVVDYSVAYPRAAFDKQSILWDLNYFKYHFLKLAQIPFSEARLETDFINPWFIDYQGGRRGALQYDVASLLYDAKAEIPEAIRDELLEHYLDSLERYFPGMDRKLFRMHYRGYVLVRILQALGAYGYRGFFERKQHFLQSVPPAIQNIERLLETGLLSIRLPELEAVLGRIVRSRELRKAHPKTRPGLTVRIGSFAYGGGVPDDPGGHGGGFVFDTRAIHNPGRYTEYTDLCGLDSEVIEFLEDIDEVAEFWTHVEALVDHQVDAYLRRGFTSLNVQFGCTGGQHRSVYFAERLARHLRERYPSGVNLELAHREQKKWAREPAPQQIDAPPQIDATPASQPRGVVEPASAGSSAAF